MALNAFVLLVQLSFSLRAHVLAIVVVGTLDIGWTKPKRSVFTSLLSTKH